MNSIDVHVKLVPAAKDFATMFAGVLKLPRKVDGLDMVLCMNFLAVEFSTNSASVLAPALPLYNLGDILSQELSDVSL